MEVVPDGLLDLARQANGRIIGWRRWQSALFSGFRVDIESRAPLEAIEALDGTAHGLIVCDVEVWSPGRYSAVIMEA